MNNAKKQNRLVGKSRQDGSHLLRRRHPSQTKSLRIFTTSRTALDLFFTKVYLDQYRFSYFLGRYSVVHLYPIIIKANQVNNCLQTSPFAYFTFIIQIVWIWPVGRWHFCIHLTKQEKAPAQKNKSTTRGWKQAFNTSETKWHGCCWFWIRLFIERLSGFNTGLLSRGPACGTSGRHFRKQLVCRNVRCSR